MDNGLQIRKEFIDLFRDYYKTITGKETYITVELNPEYKNITNKEAE